MATMESLKPEEQVRQALLRQLNELGYPSSLIAVEKEIGAGRRADIICYHKVEGELKPYLLIECKAVSLNQAAINQVIGYNHDVQAPYIAVANQHEVRCGWFDGAKYCWVKGLPNCHGAGSS